MSGQRLVTVSQSNLTIRRLKGQVTSVVSARTVAPRLIYYFTVCLPLFHHFSFLSPILDCSTLSLIIFDVVCCLPSAVTQTDYSRCLVHVFLEPFTMCVCVCVRVCVCTLNFSVVSCPTVSAQITLGLGYHQAAGTHFANRQEDSELHGNFHPRGGNS